MKLINLTPHVINIYSEGVENLSLPSEGMARCSQTQEIVGEVAGIPVTRQQFGEVTGLPEPQEDVYYVVSRLVASALPDRNDLLIPGPAIRNNAGQIIGSEGFSVL